MELNVAISVLVLLPVALALVAGGFVLYRKSTQAGWRAAGMGSLVLGVGVLVVFALTLPVSQSGEGEAPEPVIAGAQAPTEPADAPTTEQGPGAPVSTGMMLPRPASVEQLVAGAQVIVLGQISSVLEEKWIGPYGEDGQPLPAFGDEDGLPFTIVGAPSGLSQDWSLQGLLITWLSPIAAWRVSLGP